MIYQKNEKKLPKTTKKQNQYKSEFQEEFMRRNEKLLLSFLALNAAVSMNASAAENQL